MRNLDPEAPKPEVSAKLARQRLDHVDAHGKHKPLCLACGQPATNDLPSCNEKKCRKEVRPVYRWAKRVAEMALTAGVRAR